ncbi:MAG TPA: hypothetical protein DDW52_03425 [Planctomycetaceae bacterium]|nr:hypothetical protein [Planctomycetaceae bacterium]
MDGEINGEGKHLTESEIKLLVDGDLDALTVERISNHLGACMQCQARVESYASAPDGWSRFAEVIQSSTADRLGPPSSNDFQVPHDNDFQTQPSTAPSNLAVVASAAALLLGVLILTSIVVSSWGSPPLESAPPVPTAPAPTVPAPTVPAPTAPAPGSPQVAPVAGAGN